MDISLSQIKGIGPARLKAFQAAGIRTVRELTMFLPKEYRDLTNPVPLAMLRPGDTAAVRVRVAGEVSERRARRLLITRIYVTDETDTIQVVWYNQPWLKKQLEPGRELLLYGKAEHKQGYLSSATEGNASERSRFEIENAIAHVATTTKLMGRWQTVREKPSTVCDTGHNLPGWEYLSQQLKAVDCHHMHILFGMVDDKDVEGVMNLLPKNATYYFTKANSKRAISENILKLYAQQLGLKGESYPYVANAYEYIKNNAEENDFVFIGGSSYVVAEFLKNSI